ncbi:MAG: chemotaxis protein CheW [Hydrococcus sp. RM1_1_31]|nr:chemotaxis protein CheW [Hydrococcus sp. RM1_1_31]
MLFLLLNINDRRYALESQQVLEVLPLVLLEPLPHTPKYIAGIFNYRGQTVPVIDLCQFMWGRPCSEHLSTRIILINDNNVKKHNASESSPSRIFGLMAERVVDTLHKSEGELLEPDTQVNAASYLGKIILDKTEMIQCIHVGYFFSEVEKVQSLPQATKVEV